MRAKVVSGIFVGTIVLVAGYAIADAYDRVPGVLTLEPEPQAPAPFVSASPVSAAVVPELPIDSLDDTAPVPNASQVGQLARDLRADSRIGESTNVSVIDVLTGEELAGLDADDTQVPASTTKLLTAIAAVAELGPDFSLTTTATWHSDSRTLTLVAGGDMLLAAGAGHQGSMDDANGWAGMADLAGEALESVPDLTSSPVTVTVDDGAFDGPALNPEWPQYAIDQGYAGAVTGLGVNAGRVTDQSSRRHADPSLAAGGDFVAALYEVGVIATGAAERQATDASAVEVAAVESAPLSSIVTRVLFYSDNTISEMVARVLALETGGLTTPEAAAEATIAALESIGVDTQDLELYDGAGFSERNRISPSHLTASTRAALAYEPTAQLQQWLPTGGLEGTVNSRFQGRESAGLVRAKTGSLTGVTSLSGTVLTADGRLLAFAVLADGMPYGPVAPRQAVDDFVDALAQCGCDG